MSNRVRRCLQIVVMLVVAVGGVVLLLTSLATADSGILATAKTLDRDLEPVIVTGSDVGELSGAPLNELFVYSYAGGNWNQIPSQVDEVTASGDYTSTEDGLLDANDEIVFMAMDLGDQAPADGSIARDLPISDTWYEIEVSDPSEPAKQGWAYLVQSDTLAPISIDYVDYDLGTHRIEGTTYALGAAASEPYVGYLNPWFDYLTLNGGPDILDRNKTRLCLGKPFCLITEEDLKGEAEIEDDLISDGPVRVIVRGGFGLAYHSMVQWSRPISIPVEWLDRPDLRFSIDFTEEAIPATLYNEADMEGVTVDGVDEEDEEADTIENGPLSSWLQLSTINGRLIQVGDTSSMGGTQSNYYEDNSTNPRGDTGDDKRYGEIGVFIKNSTKSFTYTFALYVLPPALLPEEDNVGRTYEGYFWHPLSVRALIPPPDVSLDKTVVGTDVEPGDPITFTLSIVNRGAKVAAATVVTDILAAGVLSPTYNSTLAITETGEALYAWHVQPLSPWEGGVITITGLISPGLPSGFVMINRATVWDPEDSALGNNTDMVIVNGYTVYLPMTLRS